MGRHSTYTDEFKRQIVSLQESGRSISELSREYGIAKSSISTWCTQSASSGSFRASDNISDTEKELKKLQKENKRLLMENDILKQAALIMGRKEK
jgi:transposase